MLPDCGGVEVRLREGRRALYISVGAEWRIVPPTIHLVNHYEKFPSAEMNAGELED